MSGYSEAQAPSRSPAFLRLLLAVAIFGAIGPLFGGLAFVIFVLVIGISPNAAFADVLAGMMPFVVRIVSATFTSGWKQALGAGLIFGAADMFGRAGWLLAVMIGAVAGILVIPLDRVLQPNPLIAIVAFCGVAGALASCWLLKRIPRMAS